MIQIRPMTIEDCQTVHEIEQACFSNAWSLSMFEELFQYSTNFYFVAEEEQKICGFAGITTSIDTADVMNIGVQSGYRGRGIGRELLKQLMEQAVKCGCEQIMLEVRESNHVARQLYRTSGFEEIAVRKNYYSQPTEHGIIMRRILKS